MADLGPNVTDDPFHVEMRDVIRGGANEIQPDVLMHTAFVNTYAVALDVEMGKVYWSQSESPDVVQRADTDGSNVETLINTDAHARWIALDTLGGKMFWSEYLLMCLSSGAHVR